MNDNEKAFVLLRRKDGETLDDFRQRYLQEHTKQILVQPGIRRYTANLVEDVPAILTPESGFGNPGNGVDAVDELWCNAGNIPLFLYKKNFVVVGAYAIDEKVFLDYKPDWPVGQCSPWLKRINFLKRREDLTHEQFVNHWRTVHGPMGAKIHRVPRYVQNNLVVTLTEDTNPWDGSVQMHFWSPEEFVKGFFPDAKSKAMVLQDVKNFIGDWGGNRPAFLLSEYIMRA